MIYLPFSIAMSVYYKDDPCFLDRALQSITVEQSVLPSEIVLVCDGPLSKELDRVISSYQSSFPGLKVVRLEENKGLGNALRVAVENSSYELIARMDSDDVATSDRFEQQLKLFNENPSVDVVGGDISEFVGSESNIVANRLVPTEDKEIKQYMRKRCALNHVTVMFKKRSVLQVGGYLDFPFNEDYYLWIRMQMNNSVFANTGTVLVNVRTGEEMYSRRGGVVYYKSEIAIQRYMLHNKMISFGLYLSNCLKRFVVQLLFTNQMRGFFYRHIARRKSR